MVEEVNKELVKMIVIDEASIIFENQEDKEIVTDLIQTYENDDV